MLKKIFLVLEKLNAYNYYNANYKRPTELDKIGKQRFVYFY